MTRTISQLTGGTLVYVDETVSGVTNHIPYIYLGLDESGKARLLREYMFTDHKQPNSVKVATYNGCTVDEWLNDADGFLARFDSDTINALAYTSISYADYNVNPDNSVALVTISRRVFYLSITEVGGSATSAGSEGKSYLDSFKTFYNTTSANTSRIGQLENVGAQYWWLRSGSSTTQFRCLQSSGAIYQRDANQNNGAYDQPYARPCLSIAPTTAVSDEGAESIFLLPDGRVTTWPIEGKVSLGQTEDMPTQCKLIVPSEYMQVENYWVCNNFGDVSPTWVPCSNGGVANFGTTKTGDNWELGVKFELQSGVQGRTIGEPAMIVKF